MMTPKPYWRVKPDAAKIAADDRDVSRSREDVKANIAAIFRLVQNLGIALAVGSEGTRSDQR